MIDASTTLAWAFNEGGRGPALQLLLDENELVAPWLWRLEVVQVVTRKERQKVLTTAAGTRLLEALESMNVEIMPEPVNRTLVGLAQAGRPYPLSAHDTVYLDLAMRLNLPLLTGDQNLRDAAARVGVECPAVP